MTTDNKETIGRGRPRVHADQKAAAAAASKAYRLRKKEERGRRRDTTQPLSSKIIDLSVLPAWRRVN